MNNRNEEKMNGKHVIIANDDSVNNLDKKPDDVLFTKASEVVDYIQEQYRIYGCESDLSSMYFENVYVSDMSKRDILKAYREIQKCTNGDDMFELSDYTISEDEETITGTRVDFASDSKYDERFSGNLEEFLNSFETETAENTCFCRLLDYEEENGIITGELLEFIF